MKGITLQFEVNGQSHVLSFNRNDSRWYVLTSGVDGRMKVIPVINDDEIGFVANIVVPMGDPGQAIMN